MDEKTGVEGGVTAQHQCLQTTRFERARLRWTFLPVPSRLLLISPEKKKRFGFVVQIVGILRSKERGQIVWISMSLNEEEAIAEKSKEKNMHNRRHGCFPSR